MPNKQAQHSHSNSSHKTSGGGRDFHSPPLILFRQEAVARTAKRRAGNISMKELRAILQTVRDFKPDAGAMALATVVKAEGSTYRRAGARMLILPDGTRIGAISGGCLEADIAERARQVMASGEPRCVIYDSRSNGDVWFELGCTGRVGLLIERLCAPASSDPTPGSIFPTFLTGPLDFVGACYANRLPGALATVFRVEGACQARPGDRLAVDEAGAALNPLADAWLTEAVAEDARTLLTDRRAFVKTYVHADGAAEIMLEALVPPVSLLLCGAGPEAAPLARFAGQLGWQTTVVDERAEGLEPARFSTADALVTAAPETFRPPFAFDTRTVAVVMTHNVQRDGEWLRRLLPSPLAYIGLLGPRRRAERLLDELDAAGYSPTQAELERLHSPAGLDIGSETPDEIALSIVAEIQTVLAGHAGGFLRDRRAPIHAPTVIVAPTGLDGLDGNAPIAETPVCPLSAR